MAFLQGKQKIAADVFGTGEGEEEEAHPSLQHVHMHDQRFSKYILCKDLPFKVYKHP